MLATTFGTFLILAQSVIGLHRHHDSRPASCDSCGVENTVVMATMTRLQTSPRWRERDNAAHALRRFDWKCHPEVVEALTFSLLNDRSEEVREEAAQSLARMAPCLPVAHAALEHAARCDPDHATRRWARKALNGLGNRCEGACRLCGVEVVGPILDPAHPGLELVQPGVPNVPAKVIPEPIEPGLEPLPPASETVFPVDPRPEPPVDGTAEPLPLIPPGGAAETGSTRTGREVVEKTASRDRRRPRSFLLRLPAAILNR